MDLKKLSFNLDSLAVKQPQGYFEQKDFISNSDLSRYDALSRGKEYKEADRSIFEFGSALDCYITEPEKWDKAKFNLKEFQLEQIEKIAGLFKERESLDGCELQKEVYNDNFRFKDVAIKAKVKIDWLKYKDYISDDGEVMDFIPKYKYVYDLKSTTCLTLREFYKKIFSYAYDRAGAWYLDVAEADFYSLIVCNYTNKEELANDFNHQIWQIDFTPQMLQMGRNEYQRILRYAIDNGFVKIKTL